MKKFLSVVLALSLLMGMFSINGMASTEQQPGRLEAAAQESGAAVGDPFEETQTARQQINFNREWKFKSQRVTDDTAPDFGGATAVSFDDSAWTNVGLPHSFSIPYNMETNFFVGYGMYRKTFQVPQEWLDNGKRVSIEFEGAFIETELFVNGEEAGSHLGGYTGFTFDMTDKLHAGENTIAVRVNNKWRRDQTPRGGDHQFSGGIYRDVYLNITDGVHVAWYGTAVTTPALDNPGFDEKNEDGTLYHDYENIDESSYTPAEEIRENIAQKRSDVRVQTEVQNDTAAAQTVVVKQEVVDKADGTLVASFQSEPAAIPANSTETVAVKSDYIQNIKLWSPEEPNLYEVHTTLFGNDGEALDSYSSPLGFRWAQFLNDAFYLNGEKTTLFGANVHQDHAGWGDAVTDEGFVRDVQMVKDAGMNFIRGSHYPHDPAFADACDETGIMFWSEAVFWGAGGTTHAEDKITYTASDWTGSTYPEYEEDEETFNQSCIQGLEEMIRINRNHPSIIVWSMGNEVFFGWSKDDQKKALVNEMRNTAHKLDPTRKAAMGGVQRNGYDSLDICDVAGYNGDGGSAELPKPGGSLPGNMTEYMPSIASEYGSHTANRGESGDQFRPYFDHMQNGSDVYDYKLKGNRAGISLWCAFHHGSVLGSNLAQMGFIDYSRLPLKAWYWYRQTYTGVPAESSKEGTADHLTLTSSQNTIPNDGTADTHLIVTVCDKDGNWVNQSPNVELEVLDGPGVFPTGKIFNLKSGNTMRDGKGAIEFRSYYSGTTTIQATADGMEPVTITITTEDQTGDESGSEPDNFLVNDNTDDTPKIEDPGTYGGTSFSASRPTFCSSGNPGLANDGDLKTSWVAENAGSGEYWMQDLEQSPYIYKIKLNFDRDPYPYKIEVSSDKNGPWSTAVEYTADTIKNRPYEESLPGIYARFVKVTFTDVPEGEHAFLTESAVYAVTSAKGPMPDTQPELSYTTHSVYVSDLTPAKEITQGWAGKQPGINTSIEGKPIKVGGVTYKKGLGLHADSEAVYALDARYARFQAVIGIDDEASNGDAIYRIYATVGGSEQETLIYEQQISSGSSEFVDLSVRGVTQLRLVTDANGANSNDHTDWADAKLLGAVRDMAKADTDLTATMTSSTQGLQAGKTFESYVSLQNSGSSRKYAASLALYNSEGKLIDLVTKEDRLSRKDAAGITLDIPVPADAEVGYEARLNVYDPDTLALLAETVHFGMDTNTDEPTPSASRFSAIARAAKDSGEWSKVDGEDASVTKEGEWGLWKDSNAYEGTESFVEKDSWQNTSLSFTFSGVQAVVGGKIDGSQVGADVYLDGSKVGHIDSNSSANDGKNGYYEVWRSDVLPLGEHTVKLVPTGKFSVDYFGYLAESPWAKVDGEDASVSKAGTWGMWAGSDAYMQTETFVGDSYDWKDTSLSLTFTGIQATVVAKVDGSQVGAKVYIDDKLAGTFSTTEPDKSKEGYKEVWVSSVLTEGEHTLRLEPTGKFGLDYFEYLKPGFDAFIKGEEVDTQELLAQIANAENLAEKSYTSDSWADMQAALADAKAARDNESVTQDEVDAAATTLKDAIAALVPYEAPTDEQRAALLDSVAAVLRFIESDTVSQYEPEGVKKLAADFRSAYELLTSKNPEASAVEAMAAALKADLAALVKTEPEQKEYALGVTFPAATAQLSIDGTDLGLANLTGKYDTKVLSGTEFTLNFAPTAEGREFAGVTLNNEALPVKDSGSFVYTAEMPNADMALDFQFVVVSKQVLRAAMEIAEGLKGGEEYEAAVPAVQKKFDKALENASAIEAKLATTQEEIDNAWSELIDSIQRLSFAQGDKTALKDLLVLAAELKEDDYTASSWETFQEARTAAQGVYDDENALDPDVKEAVTALTDSMKALDYKANLETLKQLIDKANEIKPLLANEYLPVGQEAFLAALEAAEALDGNADQVEINQAAQTLADAIANLRRIPSKDALKALIDELQAVKPDGYTASSYAAFQSQVNVLLAVYNNPDATEKEIAQACETGAKAKDLLKEASTTPSKPTKKPSGSSSSNKGNSYGAAGTASATPSQVLTAAQNVSTAAYVRSDTTVNFTLKQGASYCFKMTVVNGNGMAPSFTVGDGGVLKTQFVAKAGNDSYFRVYATGAASQSAGVYTTLPGGVPQMHCTVTVK